MNRRLFWAVGVLGALVAVAPFANWYRIDVPGRRLPVTGLDAAGELWVLPVVGAGIVACAAIVLQSSLGPSDRAGRLVGVALIVFGVAALAAAAVALLANGASAIATVTDDPPGAPLRAGPLGWITAAAAAAIICLGCVWLQAGFARESGESLLTVNDDD